jgi:hypothetical protein
MYSVSNPVNSQNSTAMRFFLAALLTFSIILSTGVSTASAYTYTFNGKKGHNYHQFTVPRDSVIRWYLHADPGGTSNTIEFQWPLDQCRSGCGDYCGWYTMYKKRDIPNSYDSPHDLPIGPGPSGPGKVDILFFTDSSGYTLYVDVVSTIVSDTDKEPNYPYYKNLVHDLGPEKA